MNPMYAVMKGTAMKDKKKRGGGGGGGGGGGSASVTVATTASGNFDNAVKLAILNPSSNDFNYSNGIKDGSNSTFGTASGPTRTTQVIPIPAADYLNGLNAAGSGGSTVIIGGYIRSNNFTSANKQFWVIDANAIISQSFATGVSLNVQQVADRGNQRDNTVMLPGSGLLGCYPEPITGSSSTGFYVVRINHAGGRGAATIPQVGDSFTIRLTVGDVVSGGGQLTAIHDVTVNFV